LTKSVNSFIVIKIMAQSMTGFGIAADENFRIEVRSVNHRYIDISIKMPSYLNQFDIPLRNVIKERFRRGKFDVAISTSNQGAGQLHLNKEMAKDIYTALQTLQKELSIPGDITIDTLAEYKELLIEKEPEYDSDKLYHVFHRAITDLEAMRRREGELIAQDVLRSIEQLHTMNNEIKALIPQEVTRLQEKLTERISTMLRDEAIDSNRILQEVAIMAEKSDISEEVNRIENHVKQFVDILHSDTAIGRKLDFLLQEIHREVNTLAYKSNDYSIVKLVVEMKTEIEKIREQVQNIQ
jgi:uncharacterized protein (TIGR00255 family)